MQYIYAFVAGAACGIAACALFHQRAVNMFHEAVSSVLKEVTFIRADVQNELRELAKKL